jgi:hypothetical protein
VGAGVVGTVCGAMRSPMGELCFAAHCRHAEAEMRGLGQDVAARITGSPALAELLGH